MSFRLPSCDFNGHTDVMQFKMQQHFMNKLRNEGENTQNVSKNLNQKDLKYSSGESEEDQEEETQFNHSAFLKNNLSLKNPRQKRYLKNTNIEPPRIKPKKAKVQNKNNNQLPGVMNKTKRYVV